MGAVAYGLYEGSENGLILPVTARVRSLFVEHTKTGFEKEGRGGGGKRAF